jgi:hypothetical protein
MQQVLNVQFLTILLPVLDFSRRLLRLSRRMHQKIGLS